MNKIYIILGLPGAGKGICAQELKVRKDFIHFSLGDYLREQVRKKTEIGLSNSKAISSGLSLIPCNIAFEIIKEKILSASTQNKNIIIDGFPRTILQLNLLKAFLKENNLILHWFYLDVDPEIGIDRLLTREHCTYCGYDFIMVSTQKEGICDFCQGVLIKRSTDNRESLLQRIALFHKTTYNVIQDLQKHDNLITLDTNKSIDSIITDFLEVEKNL